MDTGGQEMTSMDDHPDRLLSRRRFALGIAGAAAAVPLTQAFAAKVANTLRVGALFAGPIDDRGFMEAGWNGLQRAASELGITPSRIDGIAPQKDALAAALTRLAESGVDLVIAHGGQNNEACAAVAARFPQQRFVVTQGNVTGPNLASYDVLQEESAYLAGVLAALITGTGVVGHMSGIRVRPGLKGRAAYAAGVRDTDPKVKLLTNFSGNQDDNALSRRVAEAQVAAGADVIFTMLNTGRTGVTDVCREKGCRQIGNVVDWVAVDNQVFVGSAIANVGLGVLEAVRDLQAGRFPAGQIRKLGLAHGEAVKLTMAPDVPGSVRERVAAVAQNIAQGHLKVPEEYDGAEFQTPA
jgi:basic membrane protein A